LALNDLICVLVLTNLQEVFGLSGLNFYNRLRSQWFIIVKIIVKKNVVMNAY